ncbi:MAG: hypothetical protein U0R65_10705 [Candidatus Nanopelagicales bacterium]
MTGQVARVVACGVATVQDGGRPGYARVGVARSGPLHRERYDVAAALLTGRYDGRTPTIELLAGALVVEADRDTTVAVAGPAHCRLHLDGAGRRAPAHAVLALRTGERIEVERDDRPDAGPVYVAVGGWAPELVLGSATTDTFGRLGGAVVGAGYVLGAGPADDATRVGAFWRPVPPETGPLRVVLAQPPFAGIVDGTWRVRDVSRSGVRLAAADGSTRPSESVAAAAAPSRPVVAGTVQCTPGGEVIVLGPDGGVTGGYPVAGVVATVDLDRLSLLAADTSVRFLASSVEDAVAAFAERQVRVRRSFGHPDLAG